MWMSDEHRLPRAFLVLALASLFCGALALTRVLYSGRGAYIWLGWNLLLAWVPLLLAAVIARRHAPFGVAYLMLFSLTSLGPAVERPRPADSG